jgi:hypothetical protein
MINIYGYPFFILASFFLLYIGFIKIIRFSGLKIKIFSLFIMFSLICRDISLTILATSKNIIFLYILKPFFYLNYLCIPVLSMIAIYIIMRNPKFKFRNIIAATLIFTLLYCIIISLMPNYIGLSNYYGYKMCIENIEYFYLFKAFINALFLIFAIGLLDKSYLEKKGVYLIIIAALIAVIEIVLTMLQLRIFQENILSDFCWIIVFIYALNQLQKNKK